MIRKTIISSIIFLSISNHSWAKGPYVGASLGSVGYSQLFGATVKGGLFAGYGNTIDQQGKFYLGGELGLNLERFYHHTYADVTASIMPGLMLTKDTLLYGRIGLDVNGSFKHQHNPYTSDYNFEPVYGVGIQQNITKHVAVRAEYINYSGSRDHQGSIGLVYSFW